MGQVIRQVLPGSIAEELGIEPGDILESINGESVKDCIDYEYLCAREFCELKIRNYRNQQIETVEIEKDVAEGLGLVFSSDLMCNQRNCANKCIFCFVDQMPKNLRPSLYVKDDDWRLSLMMGNFITLSNVSDGELQRIIDRRVSPLYISVHATDPDIRAKLVGGMRSRKILQQLKKLADAGLYFHTQFVLMPGLNDGQVLDQSLQDMWALWPHTLSAAVVPVGLTKFRDNLPHLTPYTRQTAGRLLDLTDRWREKCLFEHGTRFVQPSDEFYVLADRPVPPADTYEGYAQIENGVGMLRKFEDELDDELQSVPKNTAEGKRFLLATGWSAGKWLTRLAKKVAVHTGAKLEVMPVENRFFGPTVTVTSLLTGTDLCDVLRNQKNYDYILICSEIHKGNEEIFLDDMTLFDLKRQVKLPIVSVENDGGAFVRTIASIKLNK